MSNLDRLQLWLRQHDCHALVVPCTDEYLSEFVQPCDRRLRWATHFCGSTGLAIILQNRGALFLDGRYRAQGERDTSGLKIEVLDVSEKSRHEWLGANLQTGARFMIDTRLQAYSEAKGIIQFARRSGFEILEVSEHPIDALWSEGRPLASRSVIRDYALKFAGDSSAEKCARLQRRMKDLRVDCELISDPEDVAWLLNVRTDDSLNATSDGWHVVPIPLTRALIEASGSVCWFVDESRLEAGLLARVRSVAEVVHPREFESAIRKRLEGKVVNINLRRTPHRFVALAMSTGSVRDDLDVSRQRWRKHVNEIECARQGHFEDGKAVIQFIVWLKRAVSEKTVTELDASRQLLKFREQIVGYKGPSMPLMAASGASGALPHYVPSEFSNRALNDHPIFWMDSGGQYHGCSTDNTVCLAVGEPEAKHLRAHTLVVKGFISLSVAIFPENISSTQLDTFARQYLWLDGMDYGHATSHGVGNFMNIHEGPHIRKEPDHVMVGPLCSGLILSNEPAYYAEGDFGVRIESHVLTIPSRHRGFLQFETISRLPIDPALIDESMLNNDEKCWLINYHKWILNGYHDSFDAETTEWLNQIVVRYTEMLSPSGGSNSAG